MTMRYRIPIPRSAKQQKQLDKEKNVEKEGRKCLHGEKDMSSNSSLERREHRRSFDNITDIPSEEGKKRDVKSAKLSLVKRVFKRKYGKLKRSKSDEHLTEALNISINDVRNKEIRNRSSTVPEEMWAESADKLKRRGAVCEGDDDKREEFTKILETFMITKSMDEYGL